MSFLERWTSDQLNTFSTYLSSKLDSHSPVFLLDFDDKYVEKSVQLVRGSSFWNDLLQNPYFNKQNGKRGNDLDQFQNGFDNSDEVNDGYR